MISIARTRHLMISAASLTLHSDPRLSLADVLALSAQAFKDS
ncbi:hypothetical protein AC50_4955 [Escherichia coli 2-474-04_S3_C3]|nr:hypothetical protein AC50_4955 [Escherichia coli 2-474-04_S3_C3]